MQEKKNKKPFLKAGLGLLAVGLVALIGFIATGGSIVFLRSLLFTGIGAAGIYAGVKAGKAIANKVREALGKSNTRSRSIDLTQEREQEREQEKEVELEEIPEQEEEEEQVVVQKVLPAAKQTNTKTR